MRDRQKRGNREGKGRIAILELLVSHPPSHIPQPHRERPPFSTEDKVVSAMEHSLRECASMEKTDAKYEISSVLHSCTHTSLKPAGKHLERERTLPYVNILTQKFPKTSLESLRIKRPG